MMFNAQDKRRPGAYVNFKSDAKPKSVLADNGLPALMLTGKAWGASGFVTVDADTDFVAVFGKSIDQLVPIREALKGSRQVLVYVPTANSAVKATVTDESFTITAKYEGTAGNGIVLVALKGTDGKTKYQTIFKNRTVDTQIVADGELPQANDFVAFAGTAPNANKTLTLSGGADGTVTNSAVQDFLAGLDTQTFTTVSLGTDNETSKALVTEKVKEWRGFGRGITAIINDYSKADYEGVVSVGNGVTLATDKLTAKDAVYYVAAVMANAGTNSLTYHIYDGAVDCERKSEAETIKLLNAGNIVFTYRNGKVLIEQDINTLVTLTTEKGVDFTKNKMIRTMDIINSAVQTIFVEQFIGKMPNDLDGREVFKQQVITRVLDPLVSQKALSYAVEELTVTEGASKEAVVVNLGVRLTDAMEKLYMTVVCK